ncbi:MAG: NAD-dependent epimerase/dehydratase family protein [Roseococcus sp.]
METPWPATIPDEATLEEVLSRPDPALIADLAAVPGDILVLGAAGKMGPTLCRLAKRADPTRRVIAVARWSEPGLRERMESWGMECLSADLSDDAALAALPDAPNVIFMAARKFGSTGNEALTWAMNVLLPARVAARWASSRIVFFSTGNVLPLVPLSSGGADESVTPAPVGEYAASCLGRERVFQHAAGHFIVFTGHGGKGNVLARFGNAQNKAGILHREKPFGHNHVQANGQGQGTKGYQQGGFLVVQHNSKGFVVEPQKPLPEAFFFKML